MSTIIKLRCIDQVLTLENTPVIASGGLEEDFIQVSFCSKWDGLVRTAVFWRSEKDVYHVQLDETDTCAIPKEVLIDDGSIYFGLFGVSAEGKQRTSQAMRYTITKGAITSGTKPPDPTPDIYTELIAKYNEMIAIAADTRAKEQAFEAAMTAAQQAFEQALTQAVNADQNAFEQAMTAAQTAFEQHIQQMIADGLLPDDSVTTVKLKDKVVTTAKIADKAITAEKVADGLLVDAYNKTETLTAATAALFGLGSGAVPNDVLAAIKSLVDAAVSTANSKAKIASGSYIGSGTYGSSNPCSLKFDFEPKIIIIPFYYAGSYWTLLAHDAISTTGIMVGSTLTTSWQKDIGFGLNTNSGGSYCNRYGRKLADGTFQWYSTGDAHAQLNKSGQTYHYIAIG